MKKHENKENLIASDSAQVAVIPRTPIHQLKRTNSNLQGKNSRLPLASKDGNRSQPGLNPKQQLLHGRVAGATAMGLGQHGLKRLASNSFVNNMPDSKLKKYGSVLGGYPALKTKSLVLKDDEGEAQNDDSDDEGDNPLAAKLKNRLKHSHKVDEECSGGLLLDGGLTRLANQHASRVKQESEDVPQIEFAPNKIPELPHIPDGYEPFDGASISKLTTYTSPFLRLSGEGDSSDHESDGEFQALPLDVGSAEGSPVLTQERLSLYEGVPNNSLGAVEFDEQSEDVEFEFSVGEGLNSKELMSLLD